MLFIGVDLAWSPRNESGIAAIAGKGMNGELIGFGICKQDEEILSFIDRLAGRGPTLVAIDAPLIVPNLHGYRPVEREVMELFKKSNATPYPANRKRLCIHGKVRGEELAKELISMGFEHNPYIHRYQLTRAFFEVFPHPAALAIFGLKKILKYKARSGRSYEIRWREFKKYQRCLLQLERKSPKLRLPKEIVGREVKGLRGKELKVYEDLLDSIFCAYIAYYYWCFPSKVKVFGDLESGYIVIPVR